MGEGGVDLQSPVAVTSFACIADAPYYVSNVHMRSRSLLQPCLTSHDVSRTSSPQPADGLAPDHFARVFFTDLLTCLFLLYSAANGKWCSCQLEILQLLVCNYYSTRVMYLTGIVPTVHTSPLSIHLFIRSSIHPSMHQVLS
jgi:hypothetical protein